MGINRMPDAVIQGFKDGTYAEKLIELYGWGGVEEQSRRYRNAVSNFQKIFGARPVWLFSAPGRTEIGGNHTDHQHGEVLAAAIDLDVLAVAAPNGKDLVRIYSDGYGGDQVLLAELTQKESEYGTTAGLIRGVLAVLAEMGYDVEGFDAFVTSQVLSGSGLSSSAAFETAVGCIISGLYNAGRISPVEIAKAGQIAENVFFGKPCGLMDQMACSVGALCQMDFMDAANPELSQVNFNFGAHGYQICITNTGGSHADLTDDYAAVPAEMNQVAAFFGKEYLRGVTTFDLIRHAKAIREKCGDRAFLRALHFVQESNRASKEAKLLAAGDLDGFFEVYQQSANSSWKYLQNIYPSGSVQEQNMALALAVSEEVLGNGGFARVHGGGFAGTIQAFVTEKKTEEYRRTMDSIFGEGTCMVLRVRKEGGIQVL